MLIGYSNPVVVCLFVIQFGSIRFNFHFYVVAGPLKLMTLDAALLFSLILQWKMTKVKRHLLLGVKFITLKVWNILLQFLCFNQYYQYTIVLNDSHCTLCDFCGLVDWMSDLCWSIKRKSGDLVYTETKILIFFNVCFIRRTGLINTVRANKRVGFHQATNSLFTRR